MIGDRVNVNLDIVFEGWRMVLQKLWVSQNFSRISGVSQSCFLIGFVRLAVSFFIRRCLGVSKHFKSQSRNLRSQNVSGSQRKMLVSQSLTFTIRHPFFGPQIINNWSVVSECLSIYGYMHGVAKHERSVRVDVIAKYKSCLYPRDAC